MISCVFFFKYAIYSLTRTFDFLWYELPALNVFHMLYTRIGIIIHIYIYITVYTYIYPLYPCERNIDRTCICFYVWVCVYIYIIIWYPRTIKRKQQNKTQICLFCVQASTVSCNSCSMPRQDGLPQAWVLLSVATVHCSSWFSFLHMLGLGDSAL